MTDIDFSTIKVDGDNESIFVTANIENDPMSNLICGGKGFPEVGKTAEFGIVDDFVPA